MERYGNAILASVFTGLGGVNYDGGEEDADCDAELIARDQSAADLSWTYLGHVHDDGRRYLTNTETCNETTCNDEPESLSWVVYGSSRLDDHTSHVGKAADDDSRTTTKEIG